MPVIADEKGAKGRRRISAWKALPAAAITLSNPLLFLLLVPVIHPVTIRTADWGIVAHTGTLPDGLVQAAYPHRFHLAFSGPERGAWFRIGSFLYWIDVYDSFTYELIGNRGPA